MRRLIKITLVMLFLLGLCGCMGPDFGSGYGYPSFGYAPYSYGWMAGVWWRIRSDFREIPPVGDTQPVWPRK